jgi:ketosteroid isomerase-like protein
MLARYAGQNVAHFVLLAAGAGLLFAPAQPHRRPAMDQTVTDHDILTGLNRDYISSVQHCDVRRFDEILAPDFYCSNPDRTLVDRAGFLKQTAKPIAIKNLQAEDVMIRIMGDVAIIHARTSYLMPDGSAGGGRYTDVWAKINGQWLAVSAHVTR